MLLKQTSVQLLGSFATMNWSAEVDYYINSWVMYKKQCLPLLKHDILIVMSIENSMNYIVLQNTLQHFIFLDYYTIYKNYYPILGIHLNCDQANYIFKIHVFVQIGIFFC